MYSEQQFFPIGIFIVLYIHKTYGGRYSESSIKMDCLKAKPFQPALTVKIKLLLLVTQVGLLWMILIILKCQRRCKVTSASKLNKWIVTSTKCNVTELDATFFLYYDLLFSFLFHLLIHTSEQKSKVDANKKVYIHSFLLDFLPNVHAIAFWKTNACKLTNNLCKWLFTIISEITPRLFA